MVSLASASKSAEEEPTASKTSLYADIAVGGEYDSNVSVEEVDAAISESDYAFTFDVGVGMRQQFTDRLELGLSYDFSLSKYHEFSQVDRATHLLGADFALDFDKVDSNLSVFYVHSRLDGEEFLELYRVSPALAGFLSKKWYARGAYVYSDKSITQRPQRDAETHAGEGDLYFFRRGLRSYFNFGYKYKDEDAVAARLDYTSHSVKLRYIHRLEVFSRTTKLELAWRYEDRDYSSVTPSIGEERWDKRNRWRADYEIPVWRAGAVQLYCSYADYDSNYEPVDYTQTIAGARFVYRW
jgi:hypothetical protein